MTLGVHVQDSPHSQLQSHESGCVTQSALISTVSYNVKDVLQQKYNICTEEYRILTIGPMVFVCVGGQLGEKYNQFPPPHLTLISITDHFK